MTLPMLDTIDRRDEIVAALPGWEVTSQRGAWSATRDGRTITASYFHGWMIQVDYGFAVSRGESVSESIAELAGQLDSDVEEYEDLARRARSISGLIRGTP